MSKPKRTDYDLKREFECASDSSFLSSYVVSVALGFCKYYLHRQLNNKDIDIPRYKVGKRVLYKKGEVLNWIKQRRIKERE
jgi:hypothetical protein